MDSEFAISALMMFSNSSVRAKRALTLPLAEMFVFNEFTHALGNLFVFMLHWALMAPASAPETPLVLPSKWKRAAVAASELKGCRGGSKSLL